MTSLSTRRTFLRSLLGASAERPHSLDDASILGSADFGSADFSSAAAQSSKNPSLQSGLEPLSGTLSYRQALHLLRRVSFSATQTQAQALVGKTAEEAVALVLDGAPNAPLPEPPAGDWINEMTENPDNADNDTRNQIHSRWRAQFAGLQSWWTAQMLNEGVTAREKIVLFWSGHFTSEFDFDDMFNPPQLLYRQNQTLRAFAFGDFRALAEEMTLDGAMLNYLGGTLNSKGAPNENYARELLELFTTGVGHYTEGDVQEAARALTGWRASRFNDEPRPNGSYATYFLPSAHDTGAKRFLGVVIPARDSDMNTEFLVRQGEVRRLIDIIFEQRGEEAARFICTKIYRFFVDAHPQRTPEGFIRQMAALFRKANYEILPLLKALFASAHFFDESVVGAQIKTPAELVVGLARQLGASAANAAGAMKSMEQDLIDPPTVAGWEGHRFWLSAKTYPLRVQYAQTLIRSMSAASLAAWARRFPLADNPTALAGGIAEFLFPKPLSETRLQAYRATLLGGAPDYEWRVILQDDNAAATRLKALLAQMAKAPDMQLC